MHALGAGPHPDVCERLVAAYSEPHRHYHTVAHINACLGELDRTGELATSRAEVEAALWFHDAVYSTRASDNEERSARWAAQFLAAAGLPDEVGERVRQHIMATRHDARPIAGDSALVVDIDLSILGQDAGTYASFEQNVRSEYGWVPRALFRRRRREILQSFLDREFIYAMPDFRDRYEAPARVNLRKAIEALGK